MRFPEFKDEWATTTLGSLVDFKNGINADSSKYGSGIKYISVSDILDQRPILYESIRGSMTASEDQLREFSVTYGDILFQRSSETVEDIGQANVYLDNKPCLFGGFVIRGKKKADYDPLFMKYALKAPVNRKKVIIKGAGAQHYNIGQENLFSIRLSICEKEEQAKISRLLSALDLRMDVQRKIIKDLSDLIVSIRSYLFNGSAETSSMSLDSLFGLVTSRNTSEKPLIVFSACGQKGLIPENLYYKKKISSASTKNYFEIENNDYVYSKSSSAGFPFGSFNRFEGTEGLVSPLYIVLRPKKTINSEYLETWFKSDNCKKQLRQICQEGARNHGLLNISTKDFLSLEIPVIDLNNQMRLISLCKARLALSTAELDSLSRLKSFLLSSLFC